MAPKRKKSQIYSQRIKVNVNPMKKVLVNDPTGSRKYFQFEKLFIYEHLAEPSLRILPGHPDYTQSCEDTIYLICGLERENVSDEVAEIIQNEANSFAKHAADKWKSVKRTEAVFLKKFNQPGKFLKNSIKIPGPLKKERIRPSAPKKKNKNKLKFRKTKPFGTKKPRGQRYATTKVCQKRIYTKDFNLLN